MRRGVCVGLNAKGAALNEGSLFDLGRHLSKFYSKSTYLRILNTYVAALLINLHPRVFYRSVFELILRLD